MSDTRDMDNNRDGNDPLPTSLREVLRNLLGTRVLVTTEGGSAFTGQVGAVLGNILVLSGPQVRFIAINDITAIDVIGGQGTGAGTTGATANGRFLTGGGTVF